jgi:hypothetical protein
MLLNNKEGKVMGKYLILRLFIMSLLAVISSQEPSMAKTETGSLIQSTSPSSTHYDTNINTNISIHYEMTIHIPSKNIKISHDMESLVGTTVSQAVESIYKVSHGLVCADPRDIACINDLCQDPYKEKWWIIKVNGNVQNYSSQSRLAEGDVLELVYTEKEFYPVAHVSLQDWILSYDKER